MKYYFFKTVKDGSRNRLNPLPFQTASDGTAIIQKLNTQVAAGGMKLREAYPIGTVFCSSMCELSARAGTPYYCAGDIYPILEGNSNYDFNLPTPTKEMLDAYDEYKQLAKQEAASNLFAGKNTQTAPKKLSLLDKIRSDKRYAVPQIDKDGFFVREEDWYLLIRNILTKTATMMTGPSGTGKTELIVLAGKKLGMEVCIYNMGTMLDPISGLLGVHRLVQGGSVFDYAKFTEDIQKPCVILLDELSRAPLSANNILLPCLDSRRELPVDIAGGNGMRNIKVHPDCVFIATANIGAEYTGTTQQPGLSGACFPRVRYPVRSPPARPLGRGGWSRTDGLFWMRWSAASFLSTKGPRRKGRGVWSTKHFSSTDNNSNRRWKRPLQP